MSDAAAAAGVPERTARPVKGAEHAVGTWRWMSPLPGRGWRVNAAGYGVGDGDVLRLGKDLLTSGLRIRWRSGRGIGGAAELAEEAGGSWTGLR